MLKVVPNWEGAYPLSRSESLTALIQHWADGGSQLVLHGNEHRPDGPCLSYPTRRARAKLFAPYAAEFMTLTGPQAFQAVRAGMDQFQASGFSVPDTFCAPAWLMTPEAEDAVAGAGIRYLITMRSVLNLETRQRTRLQGEGYMGSGAMQEMGVRSMNRLIRTSSLRSTAAKIYVHPDPTGRCRWRPMLRRIESMLHDGWQTANFHDLVAPNRPPAAEPNP